MIYQPKEDSHLLENQVKKFAKGKTFLDLGSGNGIQSQAALSANAKSVLASDINPESVNTIKSKGINAIQSDLFSNIKEKFDIIAFNPPYLPEDKREDKKSKITTTGGKHGDEIILRFLKQVKSHLVPRGIILLVISSLTPKSRIKNLLNKENMKKEILSSQTFFMERIEVWKITENENYF